MRRSRSSRGAGRVRGVTRGLAGALLVALIGAGCGSAPVSSPGSAPSRAGCPVDRPLLLTSQADVARSAACTTLRGLTVRSGAALDASRLAALTAITGDLVVGPTVALDHLRLAGLRSVDGAIRVFGNGVLQGLYLPRLERAGSLEIDGNPMITTISLPRLGHVGGALRLTDNAHLEHVDASALTAIDGPLVVTSSPALTVLDAPGLARAAAVELDASRLPAELTDRLRAAAGAP